ncbi:MAG: 5'/3'-nucleotidase SurE [Anaerolineaceae bacterium]|nr:5'/3'-nucleotidase SurE [Anaerolineaceae bacterium]
MHILVTNDDGVTAPGLFALVKELRKLDPDATVLAPDHNWSASGHVKTMHRPLRVSQTLLEDGTKAWKSDGAPSDCVALGLMGVLSEKFDLVVSGINPNSNIGIDVTYSGTVTAAMEAVIQGVPGFAVSLDAPEHHQGYLDFAPAASITRRIIAAFIKQGFDPHKPPIISINVPSLKEDEFKGIRITRQGLRIYRDELVKRIDPRGRPYYWIGGDVPTGMHEEDTDFGAIKDGFVSVTPITLDMTDYHTMEALSGLDLKLKSI